MSVIHNLKKIIKKEINNILPDSIYLTRKFLKLMKRPLDLKNPKTFNEKLQWLKINDRRPEYINMVDKYAAKEFAARIIGDEYIIPTLGVWNHFDDIDFSNLPNQFALKCTHDSGSYFICKDKSSFDKNVAKIKIESGLKRNFYYYGREWPYKKIKPRIIAETYIEDSPETGLPDYKFFCFNGEVDSVMVCIDRHIKETKFYFFDKNWILLRYNVRGKNAPKDFSLPQPKNIHKMFELAAKLSKNIPFVRVDLYEAQNKIYFGEMTFYPDSGFDPNILEETDLLWGEKILNKDIK
jgi:hypothetical protein